jgi:hypothetical protein
MNVQGFPEVASTTGTKSAIRLVSSRDVDGLAVEQVEIPRAGSGETLVRVHAAAITRDELEWPVDRLPAIPSCRFGNRGADRGVLRAGAGDASSRSCWRRSW